MKNPFARRQKGREATKPPTVAQVLGITDEAAQVAAIRLIAAPPITLLVTADWRGVGVFPVNCQVEIDTIESLFRDVIAQLRQEAKKALQAKAQAEAPAAAATSQA